MFLNLSTNLISDDFANSDYIIYMSFELREPTRRASGQNCVKRAARVPHNFDQTRAMARSEQESSVTVY